MSPGRDGTTAFVDVAFAAVVDCTRPAQDQASQHSSTDG